MLCFSEANSSAELRKLRAAVVAELRRQLTSDLRLSIADRLGSLQQEAEFARYKNAVGRIVVTTLAILSFYTLLLSLLPQFMVALTVNFAISPFIIIIFAAVMGPVILYSGFPPSFFGLQTANWKSALAFSVAASLAFIAAGRALEVDPDQHDADLCRAFPLRRRRREGGHASGDDVAALLGRRRRFIFC